MRHDEFYSVKKFHEICPMELFAEVILPLALPKNLTYRVPAELQPQIQAGSRVVVQLGKRKLYTALVRSLHQEQPLDYQPKDILEIVDRSAVVSQRQLALWDWIASYYMCSAGEVMTASLPSGLKLESETIVLRNQHKEIVDEELNDAQFLIMEALESQAALSISEISAIVEIKNPLPLVQQLLGMKYILLQEEIKGGYQARRKRFVQLPAALNPDDIGALLEELDRAPKQRDLIMHFFRLQIAHGKDKPLPASRLLKESQSAEGSLQALVKKGFLEVFTDQYVPGKGEFKIHPPKELSPDQQRAYDEIREGFGQKDTLLLHGVTSSGKTEIYVRLIEEQFSRQKQVLYLVPEIALTTQLIGRMQHYFGEKVLVYHSRFSDRERVECWMEMLEKKEKPILLIGARSSVLLPFANLGLIIVDEEHEISYKQFDPAPRYHARDTAIVLGHLHQSQILLGSATPSFETVYNAQQGKYGKVELLRRFGDLPLPEIQCVDLNEKRRKREMQGHFSDTMLEEIRQVLKMGKQVILFQNRRGFTTVMQCHSCGQVSECKNCDISLTYHRQIDLLRCHYCGYSRKVPAQCPACHSTEIRSFGFGTEKLEDDLKLLIENCNIQRLDLDSTRKKNAYSSIIGDFEDGNIDILVGTQMVTKGLDFENVALVGIMNADSLLNYPDFRSNERAFQLMSQVAGRAGRKGQRGKVLIQTSQPYHHIIRKVMDNDFAEMYREELIDRKMYQYPPYIRLINIHLKHKDRAVVSQFATALGQRLRQLFGSRILGPEFAKVARVRNKYHMEIFLKLEEKISLGKAKSRLREEVEAFGKEQGNSRVQVIFDVDPF